MIELCEYEIAVLKEAAGCLQPILPVTTTYQAKYPLIFPDTWCIMLGTIKGSSTCQTHA